MKQRWWLIAAGVGICVVAYLLWPRSYCKSARDDFGIVVPICPDGRVRQTLHISGNRLRRGGKGQVWLRARALYTVATADTWRSARVPELDAKISLVDASGNVRALRPKAAAIKPREGWVRGPGYAMAWVTLPKDLHDGEYKLRARVKTKVGEGTVDLPLPLYAPARVHVLTDRPLYEPGHRVKFRALVVRARDLTPLDHRPGTWLVKNPSGKVVLEERAPAGEWGVVAGNFLLDGEAPTGRWSITWRSGKQSGTASIRVEPFTLPRFRVNASPEKPFYRANETPTVVGSVIYSSGAPVQNAKVSLSWTVSGAWPPPPIWTEGGRGSLPQKATTSATGRFSLKLPQIPADLQGKVTLSAVLSAVDPAGDRVTGAVRVLLSKDALSVRAFTPLSQGGLVGGSNNRVYLRVTTADGRPLPGAKIAVRKAWLAAGEGIAATLDADSVARIQLDPGAPVNVVIPARPRRQSTKKRAIVTRTRAHDLVADQAASLADMIELDRWLTLIVPCAQWYASDESEAKLAIGVSRTGAIVSGAADTTLGRCVLDKVRRRRFIAGRDRLYDLTFEFSDPRLPKLRSKVDAALHSTPEELERLVAKAARDARDCLPKTAGNGVLPAVLRWRLRAKAKQLSALTWAKTNDRGRRKMPVRLAGCILSRLRRHALAKPAEREALGVVRYVIIAAGRERKASPPRPTIMKGYELLVSATRGNRALGQTKLRMRPGRIPRLMMRAEPVLAKAGGTITVKLLRGPGFRGRLPRAITVTHFGDTKVIKLPKHIKKRGKYSYKIPAGKKGWFVFEALSQRALVFVRDEETLAVTVTPEKARYAPGSIATLRVQTRIGRRGAKAAVGLFGVDDSLSQLVKLPGADALRGLRHQVKMKQKAFGMLDGQALALGRIRGSFAAEATVLRVATVPKPEQLDVMISASAKTPFDPIAELTDHFYLVLAELHRATRAWEKNAPKSELMRPQMMAKLWKKALDRVAAKNEKNVLDAFGRRLRLHRLPRDLLALTNPRQVVAVGTRLPEDVENWPRWVARRKP